MTRFPWGLGSSRSPTRSTRSPPRARTAARRLTRRRSTSCALRPAPSSTPTRCVPSSPTTRGAARPSVWAIVTSSVRRLVSWLSGDPAAAASLSASKVAAATAATAVIGAAAGAAPVPVLHHPLRPAAAVHAVRVRPRGAALGVSQPGNVVSAPAVAPAQPGHADKPAAAKARRRSRPRRGSSPRAPWRPEPVAQPHRGQLDERRSDAVEREPGPVERRHDSDDAGTEHRRAGSDERRRKGRRRCQRRTAATADPGEPLRGVERERQRVRPHQAAGQRPRPRRGQRPR